MKTISFEKHKVYIQDRVSLSEIKSWVHFNCDGIVKYGIENETLYAIFENKKDANKFSLLWSAPKI